MGDTTEIWETLFNGLEAQNGGAGGGVDGAIKLSVLNLCFLPVDVMGILAQ